MPHAISRIDPMHSCFAGGETNGRHAVNNETHIRDVVFLGIILYT